MFTTQDYIDKHKLGVETSDPHAMKILNKHLLERGYVKVRRRGVWYWTSKENVPNYKDLVAKLGKIK